MSLLRYGLKRFLYSVPVLIGVSVVAFTLIHITPGSPVQLMAGQIGSQEMVVRLREQLHLNEPLYVQYGLWVGDVLRGDLGRSWTVQPNAPIATLVAQRVPVTLELTTLSVLFAICLGLPAGIVSAVRQNEGVDHFARLVSLAGVSVPNFWLGIVLIILFAVRLQVPWGAGGWTPPWEDPVENLRLMILPVITLGTAISALYARMMRSEMLDTINQDFVKNARIMGMSRRTVILHDTARNALIPVVTVIGLSFATLMSGAVIVETVFNLPGIGTLFIDGINQQDYPLVQVIILFIATVFVAVNFVVDVVYGVLDPRISYGESK
jgi:peptide/nickel transport system permease protein